MEATEKEQEDALAQINAVVNSGDAEVLLNLLTDDQIRGLAADFNEGRDEEEEDDS